MENTAPALEDQSPSSCFVRLESYSGPLDLLLQLVRKREMDIFQIDIHTITSQYIERLEQTLSPDIESAGDFIRMASLLLYIKSKSLLPPEEREEEPDPEDLKSKLSRLLASYQRFQAGGELLYKRAVLGRDCWSSPRALSALPDGRETKIDIDREKGLFQLIQSYYAGFQKAKRNYQIPHPIPSFLRRLKQIAKVFIAGSRLKYSQLLLIHKEQYSRLLSFLSILELSKAGFVSLSQKHLFSNIEIFVKKTVTEDSLAKIAAEDEKTAEKRA